jgi:hypothetical protein
MSLPPANSDRRRLLAAALLVLVAVGSRVLLGNLGYNFDVSSYVVVEQIVDQGENVYAHTIRYNYGPIWFYVVHAIALTAHLFADSWTAFLLLLSLLLALVDLMIAGLLYERFGPAAAALFLLNPVSIMISGFHRQFDNIPVLLAMVAVVMLERSRCDRLDLRFVGGLAALGLSLAVKHVFFAFPLWLALRERSWRRRIAALVVPPLLFLLGFVPFLAGGRDGIVRNVFLYRSMANAPLWRSVFGPVFGGATGPALLLFAALLVGAWLERRRDRFHGLLVYTVVVVAFSPAVANQYLAIPVAAASSLVNPFFVVYSLVAGAHLVFDPVETGPFIAPAVAANLPDLFPLETALLLGAWVWVVVKDRLRRTDVEPAAGSTG